MLNWGFRCCINGIGDIYASALSRKEDNLELQHAHFTLISHFTFSPKQVIKQEKKRHKNLQQQKLPQIINQSTTHKENPSKNTVPVKQSTYLHNCLCIVNHAADYEAFQFSSLTALCMCPDGAHVQHRMNIGCM